ncbi:hypothetical protein ABIC16_003833 [Sphingomonas sp. PvP055]|uniref:hypothetical protein n=1 Tax=Sphingomonas sp. PvP055 TaxID=3156391 RepID=UPI003395B5ED
MLWKLFAVVLVVFFLVGLTPHARDTYDIIGFPIEVIACIGVTAYAFRLPTSQNQLWMAFGWIFAGWSVLVIAVGATRGFIQGLPPYAIAFAFVYAATWLYPTWLALHRLARAEHS